MCDNVNDGFEYRGKEDKSMKISKNQKGTALEIALEGRLDTTTAPQLESELKSALSGTTELVFDLAKLDYISSAGLRVLLSTQKVMNKQGSMKIINVNETIMEVFDVTGFVDILTIE
jgi:anti-sigma B factor antagonist